MTNIPTDRTEERIFDSMMRGEIPGSQEQQQKTLQNSIKTNLPTNDIQTDVLQMPKIRIKPLLPRSEQTSPSKLNASIRINIKPQPYSRLLTALTDSDGFQRHKDLVLSEGGDHKEVSNSHFDHRRRSGRLALQGKREFDKNQRDIEVVKQIEEGNSRVSNGVSSVKTSNESKDSSPIESVSEPIKTKSEIVSRRKSKRIRESYETSEEELILKRRNLEEMEEELTIDKPVITYENGRAQFNEPPITAEHVGTNGLLWAAPPTQLDWKEALSHKQKLKKYNVFTKAAAKEASPTTKDELMKREKALSESLTTHENENLQKDSNIRYRNGKSFKASEKPENNSKTRETMSFKISSNDKIGHKLHVKASLSPVKRPVAGLAVDRANVTKAELHMIDLSDKQETQMNNDFCSTCGDTGIFLCCEGCPKSFHFSCCCPPYQENNLPKDAWFCYECLAKRKKQKDKKIKHTGMFGKLLTNLEGMNSVQFKLPKKIRERFENVYTSPTGVYYDESMKILSASQKLKNHLTEPDVDVDFYVEKGTGKPLVCQKCGDIAYQSNKDPKSTQMIIKPIITCDFCPLSWHIDCLTPPMANVKQTGKKWKCPIHVNGIIKTQRRLKKGQVFVDRDISFGIENNGDIEIYDEDSEDDSRVPSIRCNDTSNGISAVISNQQLKLWKDQENGITRLASRGIIVDFASTIRKQKERERDLKINEILKITKENNSLLRMLNMTKEQNNLDYDEKMALVGLFDLKKGGGL